jgi:hypothetical protein
LTCTEKIGEVAVSGHEMLKNEAGYLVNAENPSERGGLFRTGLGEALCAEIERRLGATLVDIRSKVGHTWLAYLHDSFLDVGIVDRNVAEPLLLSRQFGPVIIGVGLELLVIEWVVLSPVELVAVFAVQSVP